MARQAETIRRVRDLVNRDGAGELIGSSDPPAIPAPRTVGKIQPLAQVLTHSEVQLVRAGAARQLERPQGQSIGAASEPDVSPGDVHR
jgi:hypothetical protein